MCQSRLLFVYNECQRRVCFQNFQGKPSNYPSLYRPISLLDTARKVFERISPQRMEKFVEESGGLSPNQYGFRSTLNSTKYWSKILRHERLPAFFDLSCGTLYMTVYLGRNFPTSIQLHGLNLTSQKMTRCFSSEETRMRKIVNLELEEHFVRCSKSLWYLGVRIDIKFRLED